MKNKRGSNSSNGIFLTGLIIGILSGFVLVFYVSEYVSIVVESTYVILIALFLLLTIIVVAIIFFKDKILNKIFGDSNFDKNIQNDIYRLSNYIYDKTKNENTKPTREDKEYKKTVSNILKVVAWSTMRSWALRIVLSVFVALGGIMGSMLLFKQNHLLEQQNKKFELQNSLLSAQNTKIERQNELSEVSQKSSLVFMLSNLLDKVDEELKINDRIRRGDDDERIKTLSPPLINRIIALSRSFYPYKSVENVPGTRKSIFSPERGQLLIAVLGNKLDSITENTIIQNGDFSYSIAPRMDFENAQLSRANLNHSYLGHSNFRNANLQYASLRQADLKHTVFNGADLRGAMMDGVDLYSCDFRGANLLKAYLANTKFHGGKYDGAILTDAVLLEADLNHAEFTYEQLLSSRTLYNVKNLDSGMEARLKSKRPCLFTKKGCESKTRTILVTMYGDTIIQ